MFLKLQYVICLLRFLLMFSGIAFPCWTYAALTHTQPSVKAISKVYGFLLGQNFSLTRIERTYPEMAMQVEMARLTFNAAFPDIQKKLEAELVSAINDGNFKKIKTELEQKLRDVLSKQQITPHLARQFLEQVKARAKGDEMELDVLRYLLAVQYSANPVGEFSAQFRQRFRTDGSGKAQGIRLGLQLPRSWLANEGERPHIVQKWTSEGGTGDSIVMLDIRDAEGYNPTRNDIERFVKSGEVHDIVPEGGVFHEAGTFSMEKRTGFWVDMSVRLERAGIRMYQRSRIHQLFINGKAVGLMCMSFSRQDEPQKADAAAKLNKPICQQVLNSLVLDQAY